MLPTPYRIFELTFFQFFLSAPPTYTGWRFFYKSAPSYPSAGPFDATRRLVRLNPPPAEDLCSSFIVSPSFSEGFLFSVNVCATAALTRVFFLVCRRLSLIDPSSPTLGLSFGGGAGPWNRYFYLWAKIELCCLSPLDVEPYRPSTPPFPPVVRSFGSRTGCPAGTPILAVLLIVILSHP